MAAWKLKLKGITIYRYGTRKDHVLSFGESDKASPGGQDNLVVVNEADFGGDCASGICQL